MKKASAQLCRRFFVFTLSLLGKNSLWVYLLHQPVIYAVLWLIFRF